MNEDRTIGTCSICGGAVTVPSDWLTRSLASARAEVATWPDWKKRAMRVLPDPEPRPESSIAIAARHDPRGPRSPGGAS